MIPWFLRSDDWQGINMNYKHSDRSLRKTKLAASLRRTNGPTKLAASFVKPAYIVGFHKTYSKLCSPPGSNKTCKDHESSRSSWHNNPQPPCWHWCQAIMAGWILPPQLLQSSTWELFKVMLMITLQLKLLKSFGASAVSTTHVQLKNPCSTMTTAHWINFVATPSTWDELRAYVREYRNECFPGCIGSTDARHIPLRRCRLDWGKPILDTRYPASLVHTFWQSITIARYCTSQQLANLEGGMIELWYNLMASCINCERVSLSPPCHLFCPTNMEKMPQSRVPMSFVDNGYLKGPSTATPTKKLYDSILPMARILQKGCRVCNWITEKTMASSKVGYQDAQQRSCG